MIKEYKLQFKALVKGKGGATMRQINLNAFARKSISALMAICLLLGVSAFGQIGGDYILTWSTMDGGGGQSSGGQFVLTGTIGQPDATYSSGGDYELHGGFWPGGLVCIADIVNFYDFAKLAEHWLEVPCNAQNNWCGGADLDHMGDVDTFDLKLFVDEWLFYRCPYNWPLR